MSPAETKTSLPLRSDGSEAVLTAVQPDAVATNAPTQIGTISFRMRPRLLLDELDDLARHHHRAPPLLHVRLPLEVVVHGVGGGLVALEVGLGVLVEELDVDHRVAAHLYRLGGERPADDP